MKKQQVKAGLASILVGLMSPLAIVMPRASAADITFAGRHPVASYDGLWNTGSNWTGLVAPANGDTAIFPTTAINQEIDNNVTSLSLVKIIFNGTKDMTSSKSFKITGNAITITSAIEAIMTGSGGDHAIKTDITLGADATFKTTGSNTLAIGDTDKTLDLGANDLTLDASGGTISLLGKITGTGAITKSGTGQVKVLATPGTGGFSGAVSVAAGDMVVEQNLGLGVTVSGGRLKGTGTVGAVSMSSGAIAPGLSPGVINTGNLTLTGGAFEAELGGTGAGQFDQTNVTGTVNLGTETTLTTTLVNSFAPKIGDKFIIVNNDGTDAVQGTFKGLAENALITVGEYNFRISYKAGTDGNDVELRITGVPGTPDTGIGSLITNPYLNLFLAVAVLGTVGTLKYVEVRKK